MVNLLETESFGKYLRYAFYVVKYYECLIIRLRGSAPLIRLGKGSFGGARQRVVPPSANV